MDIHFASETLPPPWESYVDHEGRVRGRRRWPEILLGFFFVAVTLFVLVGIFALLAFASTAGAAGGCGGG